MKQEDTGEYQRRLERDAEEGMGDAAMVLKASHGPAEAPQRIDVGELGRYGHGQRGVGRTAVEAGPGEARTGQNVRDRLHEED